MNRNGAGATPKITITYICMALVLTVMVAFTARVLTRFHDGASASAVWHSRQSDSDAQELASEQQQISELSSQIRADEQQVQRAKPLLHAVGISDARFYWSTSQFLEQPVVAFTIVNNGRTSLKRVYFHGVLSTPGRKIAWVDDGFNYEFKGGLEPAEHQDLELEPNMFGAWGAAETKGRSDLTLALTVENYEGPDGKPVVDMDAADDSDKRIRLRDLRASAAALAQKLNAQRSWW
jgi:hypothetical protein